MRHTSLLFLTAATLLLAACQNTSRSYESVDGDPMQSRIYTLDNGLKVYLTVNKDEPRIQTFIAVRAGGKNDPAETTGLAHYLEHIMFKGTDSFGTSDYEAERPLLDSIRALYEVYRQTTDDQQRKDIYACIDSISYLASTYAIANEYDKLMASIGSNGTNAYTSTDVTCYTEDIPSNEVENWAIVQADRFQHMVIRGFHTELEAVYEEYNRGLTNDFEKMYDKICTLLFPHHPYGQQTIIGSQEHLKNPSITNIEAYFQKYYVPNNIAICMSGDLDFDETMDIIEKYFGEWQGHDIEPLTYEPEQPITDPQTAEVYGLQTEMVMLGWRLPGANDQTLDLLELASGILQNGKAGLIDNDLLQGQQVLQAMAFPDANADYSGFYLIGMPKEGQTLEQVRELLVAEVQKLADGDFDEGLLTAIVNNLKLDDMRELEHNRSRAGKFVDAFVNQIEWKDAVERTERIARLTKDDVVAFAKQWLAVNAYACIYKRQGPDPNEKKIDKPLISPIEMNRDKVSPFVAELTQREVEPIQPVFVDFDKDLSSSTLPSGNELLYKENTQNGTFSLRLIIEHGSKADNLLPIASDYLTYLGTGSLSVQEIQFQLYQLACNADIAVAPERTTLSVNGLAENEEQAVEILAQWIAQAEPQQEIYDNLVEDELRARLISKSEEQACYRRLFNYCVYGPVNPSTDIPSAQTLRSTNPQNLLDKLRELTRHSLTALYYGPSPSDEAAKLCNTLIGEVAQPIPAAADNYYPMLPTPENAVYLAPYDSKAIRMAMVSCNGEAYDPAAEPAISLFNEYFGGGMNTIVFQELRESRGLAYQASAWYHTPAIKEEPNWFTTYIVSQNDKMTDCIDVFQSIIEQLPASDTAFPLAKDALLKRLATERTFGNAVLGYVLSARRLGLDHDINADIYAAVQSMTLEDLETFAREHVAGRTYKYIILGHEPDLDQAKLQSLGPVHRLSLEEIFGY